MKRRVYLDTSAYLASLLNERRAGAVREATANAAIYSTVLLVAETRRTLVRLARERRLSLVTFGILTRQVDVHVTTFALAPVTAELGAHPVMPQTATPRTLDLLHLRTALHFHEQRALTAFLSLDLAQNDSTQELGLPLAAVGH